MTVAVPAFQTTHSVPGIPGVPVDPTANNPLVDGPSAVTPTALYPAGTSRDSTLSVVKLTNTDVGTAAPVTMAVANPPRTPVGVNPGRLVNEMSPFTESHVILPALAVCAARRRNMTTT